MDEHLTPKEFIVAFSGLDSETLAELTRCSRLLGVGDYSESKNALLNEAIVRTLSKNRRCPRGLNLRTYLINTMRSIASAERQRLRNVQSVESGKTPEDLNTPEQALLEKQARAQFLQLFQDDPRLLEIAIGMLEGLRGAELQRDLDNVTYATLRQTIYRRIEDFRSGISRRRRRK